MNSEEQDIEESISNISISEKDKSCTTTTQMELYEYNVISKFFDEDNDFSQLIYLP